MPYTVALVVIARNEAAGITRLLTSLRPWVDRMLVLDTGSSDDTATLATAAGAEVRHFSWCDDFSAARNAALDAAGADWHVVVDADEWLLEGGEALAALRGQKPDFVGTLEQLNPFDTAQGEQTGSLRISRILPGFVRYAGRVHEQPQHELPVRVLPVRVGHDGYRAPALAAKRGRNAALLQQMLRDQPQDAYAWYQLGKEHDVYEEHEAAETAFAEAERFCTGNEAWWADLAPRRLYGWKRLGRHAEAMDWAFAQLPRCGGSTDFLFALGDLLLDVAASHPEQAGSLLPLAEDCWRRCLELGEQTGQAHAVAGRGSYSAAHNLALILEGTGREAEARQLRAAYPPAP